MTHAPIATFTNADAMFAAMLRDCMSGVSFESREGPCREVDGCHWVGRIPAMNNLVTNPVRKLDPSYAAAEVLWYLSHTSDTEMIESYAPVYRKHWTDPTPNQQGRREDSPRLRMHGAVGGRIPLSDPALRLEGTKMPPMDEQNSQLYQVVEALKDSNTRRAVMSFWSARDLWDGSKYRNVPCYIALCFRIQKGRLSCLCTMRSNDAWLGAPYDVFAFSSIQMLIAEELGIPVGWYTHAVSSLHLYDKHLEKAQRATKHAGKTAVQRTLERSMQDNTGRYAGLDIALPESLQLRVGTALKAESLSRELLYGAWTDESRVDHAERILGLADDAVVWQGSLLRDLTAVCVCKSLGVPDAVLPAQQDLRKLVLENGGAS